MAVASGSDAILAHQLRGCRSVRRSDKHPTDPHFQPLDEMVDVPAPSPPGHSDPGHAQQVLIFVSVTLILVIPSTAEECAAHTAKSTLIFPFV